MGIRHTSFCALSFVTALAFGAPLASVTPELEPVAVTATAVRFDIHSACPAIDQQLQRSLSALWIREAHAASMRVSFSLQGGRVTDVSFRGAPWSYRRDIRSAVSRLDCVASPAQPQAYAFQLVFVGTDDDRTTRDFYASVDK